MPEGFLLLRPWWLLGLLPLIWFLRRGPRGPASPWEGLVDPHLLPHLLVAPQAGPNRSWSLALPLVWILAVLALAGPAWDRGPPVHYRTRTPPLVIALDLSRSMDAGDLRPSRLALARAELRELLEELSPYH
ncbi:MAG: hypothetical protein U9Q81_19375, partial [Pseudomonadota bacterium]|nr:hypothetical protein [Pseudomonadota bacterium]